MGLVVQYGTSTSAIIVLLSRWYWSVCIITVGLLHHGTDKLMEPHYDHTDGSTTSKHPTRHGVHGSWCSATMYISTQIDSMLWWPPPLYTNVVVGWLYYLAHCIPTLPTVLWYLLLCTDVVVPTRVLCLMLLGCVVLYIYVGLLHHGTDKLMDVVHVTQWYIAYTLVFIVL